MTISMYQASIPVFISMLENLKQLLRKAEVFVEKKNIEQEVLTNSRLAPDMFPLSRQIQIATDIARRGIARLADIEIDSVEDNEKTITELINRIDNTIDFLNSIKPEQVDGTEERALSFKAGGHTLNLTGEKMLLHFSLPNFYFHITTAYNILRHNGVELGKMDYLGNPMK
jgi:hypothetical protein